MTDLRAAVACPDFAAFRSWCRETRHSPRSVLWLHKTEQLHGLADVEVTVVVPDGTSLPPGFVAALEDGVAAGRIVMARVLPDGACPGPCNHLWLKTGKGTVEQGDPVLCSRCVTTLRGNLRRIEHLVCELKAQADGYRTSTASDAAITMHRGGSASKPSPSPSGDLADEIQRGLREWMRQKEALPLRTGQITTPMREIINWLYENLALYTHDRLVAARFLGDVHAWHARLSRVTKTVPALVSKPVECPRCGQMSLTEEPGSGIVRCGNCNRPMTTRDYEELAANAAETDALIAAEAAGR